MEATIKITVSEINVKNIKEAIATLEAVKHDHPELFQKAVVVIEC